MIEKLLYMDFLTDEGGKMKISLKDIRTDLSSQDINEAMDTIIATGVFQTNKGNVTKKSNAYYLTKETEEIDII